MTDSDPDVRTDDEYTPPPQQGQSRHSFDESEDQLAQLQKPQNSASPRPIPRQPPPPVPPHIKPSNKQLNNTSNNILLNLDNLDKKEGSFSRGRLRRRRASLPSINILPSFKSLKSVMGFGIDEEDKDKDKDKEKEKNEQKQKQKQNNNNNTKKSKKMNNKMENKHMDDNNIKKEKNDKNKRLNPKEIKQIYIKNLKLQAQIDKYKEREKEFDYKLSEQSELIHDLKNQIQLKSQVMMQLDEQLSASVNIVNESMDLKKRVQELERLLVEKDTTIQTLQQSMVNMEKQKMLFARSVDTLSPTDSYDRIGDTVHKRSLTPGGYQLNAPWDVTQNDIKTDDDFHNNHPSAPPLTDQFLDDRVHGLSLQQKLSQRPAWKELESRGILLDDPTTKKSQSLQAAHRNLHRRKASQKLDKLLINRPNKKQLHDTNILKNIDEDNNNDGLALNEKIKQRPSWKDVNARGILLDDPTTQKSPSLQAAQRQLHKRKASKNLDKLLINRPSPNDLHAQNIIDARTAALFFGASPTTQVVTPKTDYLDNDAYTTMINATDSLYAASQPASGEFKSNPRDHIIYKDNPDKSEIVAKLEPKIKQRPSIDETMARGILLHRTDTKLNYDLQDRFKQLHKRKASQNLEKLMMKRPKSQQLEEKGILINESEQKRHKRKKSEDLKAGLQRRPSLSEMQGLGLLFTGHGYEYDIPESDPEDPDRYLPDSERDANIASLFKQKPRTSKPLHETDFKGIEFDHFGQENDQKTSGTEQFGNKRRGSVNNATEFEPYKLSKQQRISRIGLKLQQRPSVEDMKMRGLLYEHPSISKSLVERKRDLMKRRASNKVESMLLSRASRTELENKNILLHEEETLEQRKQHKRTRSKNLENAIQRRPKLMEEQEAHRQRRRSMDDSDFTPDYLSHILDDDEEDEFKHDLQQIEIRFLNIGGYVIPIMAPHFMHDLMGDDGGDGMNEFFGGDDGEEMKQIEYKNEETMELIAEVENLKEEMDDLKQEIDQKEREIKQKDVKIDSLKGENSSLKQKFSRKSLMDYNHLNVLKKDDEKEKKEIERLDKEILRYKKEIEAKNQYFDRLSYYMKEEKNIKIPTAKQLKNNKMVKNKLKNHFKQRPSYSDLQEKQILSANFLDDVTNQNAQISQRKAKFGRTSQLISNFLESRPSKDTVEQYFDDSMDYNDYIQQQKNYDGNIRYIADNIAIVDNATKDELRKEVVRLNNKLAEKIGLNNKLEKENETMRFKIQENLDENSEILGRGLKEHSIYESKFLNQALTDLHKEHEENQMITELKGENENLKQKMRRLSTVEASMTTKKENEMSEMKQFVNWSSRLSWPDIIQNIYRQENNMTDFVLMKKVIHELRENSENNERKLQFEITELTKEINELKPKHTHKSSELNGNPNNNLQFANFENADLAMHALTDSSANRIVMLEKKLEKQKKDHLKDKEKFVKNTMNELNRLRTEIKQVGRAQEIIQQQRMQQIETNGDNSYYNYLSGATSYFWTTKK